ncbi:shugoshin_C domain-containing protein [Caerostris extrusa]|uniref:Shugoshin_C domain-containing protein n=1 Tax=Caerostris extrusa TaxID=172846 RepID=A0AAV4P3U8_CAEEX|nr:shugoshin_C domain-containing protein [Caerostris extrusa]
MSQLAPDRRETFTLNSFADNNRRKTFLVPANPVEHFIPSPPTISKTVQNVVPNETVLLCEDMELTEIITVQNQQQFHPTIPPWAEVVDGEEPSVIESPGSVENLSDFATFAKKFPLLSANSNTPNIKVLPEIIAKTFSHEKKDMQDIIADEKCKKKSETSNYEILTKPLSSCKDTENSDLASTHTEPQQFPISKKERKKGSLPKKRLKSRILLNLYSSIHLKNIKSQSTSKTLSNQDKQIQGTADVSEMCHNQESTASKILSSEVKPLENPLSSNIEKTSTSLVNKRSASGKLSSRNLDAKTSSSSNKKSMRISSIQNALETMTENELVKPVKSPLESMRRSSRRKVALLDNFDFDDSDIDPDIDFEMKKQFSLKPGRKVSSPNNKNIFVFNKTKKLNTNMIVPIDFATNNSEEKDSDIFNFSASSEADKSPIKKSKRSKNRIIQE